MVFLLALPRLHAGLHYFRATAQPDHPAASLQIPYLLSLAGMLVSYLPAFPFSVSIFRVLKKIDEGFASLLRTRPLDVHNTEESVVSRTEKVRIKSLIEETRVVLVNIASGSGLTNSTQDFSSDDDSETDEAEDLEDAVEMSQDGIGMGLGRVYKKTLEILGDELT